MDHGPYSRILVPLDGSVHAERALPVAAHIARQSGGTIILVRAVPLAPSFGALEGGFVVSEASEDVACERASAYLARIAREPVLAELHTDRIATVGAAVEVILAAAHQADLIVIASHKPSRLPRWLRPSVAESVARQARCPVMIVRKEIQAPSSAITICSMTNGARQSQHKEPAL